MRQASAVTGCYAFVVRGSDETYHLRTVQPGTVSVISAAAATGGMGNHFLAAAAPLGAGEQRALRDGDRLLVGSPPSLEVEVRLPVYGLGSAKPLPLNSGGGVALVDCQRCDGACVVAWDGVASIETSLAKWDRRRCVDEKCMRTAKSWLCIRLRCRRSRCEGSVAAVKWVAQSCCHQSSGLGVGWGGVG